MARVKQWVNRPVEGDVQSLSYLLYDPISRRSALIDPCIELLLDYQQTLTMRGMTNRYLLFTRPVEWAVWLRDLPGDVIDVSSTPRASTESLALGESRILLIRTKDESTPAQAFVCDGAMFTGTSWLPGMKDALPPASLMNFPDDYIIYPGQVNRGYRISCIGQERARIAEPDLV